MDVILVRNQKAYGQHIDPPTYYLVHRLELAPQIAYISTFLKLITSTIFMNAIKRICVKKTQGSTSV